MSKDDWGRTARQQRCCLDSWVSSMSKDLMKLRQHRDLMGMTMSKLAGRDISSMIVHDAHCLRFNSTVGQSGTA